MSRAHPYDVRQECAYSGPRHDITSLVDAACVAHTLSEHPIDPEAPQRVERPHAAVVSEDGWFENGDWYEPVETLGGNAIEGTLEQKRLPG